MVYGEKITADEIQAIGAEFPYGEILEGANKVIAVGFAGDDGIIRRIVEFDSNHWTVTDKSSNEGK